LLIWRFVDLENRPTDFEQQVTAMKQRTKRFALRGIRMCQPLPKTDECRTISRQLLRSATSIAANYRSACRARSKAEFIAKMGIVVEESDESVLWIELFIEADLVPSAKLQPLLGEANELLAIFAASQRTARGGSKGQISKSTNQPMKKSAGAGQ
jgi:four helix bundle protein